MKTDRKPSILAVVSVAGVLGVSVAAWAQSATTYSSGTMWGTSSAGVAVNGALDSADGHAANTAIANSVNAARKGPSTVVPLTIYNSTSTSNTTNSVGTQSIVSNQVTGNSNSIGSASQTANNNATVGNSSTITH